MFMTDLLSLSSYDYSLPKELIAQVAFEPADKCKMLYFNRKTNKIEDLIFSDIYNFLWSNDVLFLNNSKVVKARVIWDNKRLNQELLEDKIDIYLESNQERRLCLNCEILFLKNLQDNIFQAMVRPGKKFKIWVKLIILKNNEEYIFEVLSINNDWTRIFKNLSKKDIFCILEDIWQMPLPPYIQYSKEKEKPYQPIQAKKHGSVAAPTASLHFTKDLLNNLKDKWVSILESTLHVWMWTFKTVNIENISLYDIHSETVEIPKDLFEKISLLKEKNKNILAVWTTSARILESLAYVYKKIKLSDYNLYKEIKTIFFDNLTKNITENDINKFIDWDIGLLNKHISFDTKLYIYPWFNFVLVDKLITNFHLPKSSLLMLVSAFMWYENMIKCYKYAIDNKYRFFSFWDAMFIE